MRPSARRVVRALFAVTLIAAAAGPRVSTQSSGPVAAYAFSDGAGTAALDSSGTDLTADLIDGPSWTTSGRFGSALTFDGSNDGVRLPASTLLDLDGSLTVSAWIRPTAAHTERRLIVQTSGPDSNGLSLTSDGRPAFNAHFASGWNQIEGSEPVPVSAWTHLAATYDGTTVALYLNGVLVASGASSGAIRNQFPGGDPVDQCSAAYNAGEGTGKAWGAAAASALAARQAGFEVWLRRYPRAGGGGVGVDRNGKHLIRFDWHKFKKYGQWMNRPHIDMPGKAKHWPW